MQSTSTNPYKSPDASPGTIPEVDRQVSFVRGFLCALPTSGIGFAIPYVVLAVLPIVQATFFGYSPVDRDADLQELPTKAMIAAIGCSIVFGLAAILNYSPARKLGIIRALLLVGLSAVFGLFVMGVAALIFDLGPRSYFSDPFFPVRCAITVSVPVVFTFLILQRVIRHKDRGGHPTPHAR